MAQKARVVVEVSGGVVQAVYAAEGTQVLVVDWDDISEGDGCPAVVSPDAYRDMPESTKEMVKVAFQNSQ
jgi:hypothetical protein